MLKLQYAGHLIQRTDSLEKPLMTTILFSISVNLTTLRYLICRRQWHPTPLLLPGKSHGQRSLEDTEEPGGIQSAATAAKSF